MSITDIRKKFIAEIETADAEKIKNLYRLYRIAQEEEDTTTWQQLLTGEKEKVHNGIKQLKQGKGKPANKLIAMLNKKHGVA